MMTKQQRIAYASPCFEAEETLKPEFHFAALMGGQPISVTLTANIGLE